MQASINFEIRIVPADDTSCYVVDGDFGHVAV